jgi:macrolide transport system ATP-binding/permease protein
LLADEPTGALDSKSGAEVMALLKELAQAGHTVILITHDARVAAEADRVIQISDGVIQGDQASEKTPPSVGLPRHGEASFSLPSAKTDEAIQGAVPSAAASGQAERPFAPSDRFAPNTGNAPLWNEMLGRFSNFTARIIVRYGFSQQAA